MQNIKEYRSTHLFSNLEIYHILSFINIIKIFLKGSLLKKGDFLWIYTVSLGFFPKYTCYDDITKPILLNV